ncbi:hypothetical protein DCS_05563 [Drechmeria coniospora]|uniref:Uncharacterized protein n=1 Tax=Drechmeria coniospora TaxID=98403 RepID=A0A151GA29_DRECN|nr:uncharacterized protein DCS_08283 [Drechmeria coniospora]XP_040657898.1 hypothetical protein DCS_05563 [Drechmeria coniospora]KYK53943.1 hypothetical protein DCS_08283 [Drechmeria coniospora]KYK58546.1 hypothetical protein DCS_05563 [Drechmeria coniospora]
MSEGRTAGREADREAGRKEDGKQGGGQDGKHDGKQGFPGSGHVAKQLHKKWQNLAARLFLLESSDLTVVQYWNLTRNMQMQFPVCALETAQRRRASEGEFDQLALKVSRDLNIVKETIMTRTDGHEADAIRAGEKESVDWLVDGVELATVNGELPRAG